MAIAVSSFGDFEGQRVDEAVLISDSGVCVKLLNWGVVVRDWQVPVADGLRSVVLGFDNISAYVEHSPYFGAVVGRVANRIKGAQFKFGGQTYSLDANEGGDQLHGGSRGLSQQVWKMEPDSVANVIKFSLDSPAGEMGYPGNVHFEAIYSLSGNKLRLDLSATTDEETPISVVQHQYFNLGATNSVIDHEVHLPSSVARTESDDQLLVTGVISPTNGTKYDFLSPRTMREPDGTPIEYDLNMVLATGRNLADPIAIARGEDRALTLKLWSDQPGLQVYNGVTTNVSVPGLNGKIYAKHSGLCFEDQMFPDAMNQLHFPNIVHSPDKPYAHWCAFEIA